MEGEKKMSKKIQVDIDTDILKQLKNSCFDSDKMINNLLVTLIKNALEREKARILLS